MLFLMETTERHFKYVCDDYIGYCRKCKKFTRECTEPDAEGYDCPICGEDSVIGAELALIMGEITFSL
jgi:hypothetical protein